MKEGTASFCSLAELRATHEPFVSPLADLILVSLPPWIPPKDALDNWQTSACLAPLPSLFEDVPHPRSWSFPAKLSVGVPKGGAVPGRLSK